jgi:hypothetical protein
LIDRLRHTGAHQKVEELKNQNKKKNKKKKTKKDEDSDSEDIDSWLNWGKSEISKVTKGDSSADEESELGVEYQMQTQNFSKWKFVAGFAFGVGITVFVCTLQASQQKKKDAISVKLLAEEEL